ncbi:hypothetical protein BT67DRAFT_248178 [Trichocladium antarcticum]|uniref:Uncharacterized protein n=1 Tax=Trichocladium antarcticum TaxID=1450529 RepID=A0AAN6UCG1_9PEZI|nr:hypothetical protein BT67DRAFT_248178 [Trichocladium antarcticum]
MPASKKNAVRQCCSRSHMHASPSLTSRDPSSRYPSVKHPRVPSTRVPYLAKSPPAFCDTSRQCLSRIQVNAIRQQRRALVQQLPPRRLKGILQHHQQRRIMADPLHVLELLGRRHASVFHQILARLPHLVLLRRRWRHGARPRGGAALERIPIAPDHQRGKVQHPRPVEQHVVARRVPLLDPAVSGGGRPRHAHALGQHDRLQELQRIVRRIARLGRRRPRVAHAPLRAVEILGPDRPPQQPLGPRKDLAVDNVHVHGHVREVVQHDAALKDDVGLAALRHVVVVGVRRQVAPSEQRLVKVALPRVERPRQRPPPLVAPAQRLRDPAAQRVDLEISLVHVPADAEQARHEDGAAERVRLHFLVAQGPLEALEKRDGLVAHRNEIGLGPRHLGAARRLPQLVVARQRQAHLVRNHYRRVAKHGGVDRVDDKRRKRGPPRRLVGDPVVPQLLGRMSHPRRG